MSAASVLGIAQVLALAGLACFVGGALMRRGYGHRWDRVILGGACLMAASLALVTVVPWLLGEI